MKRAESTSVVNGRIAAELGAGASICDAVHVVSLGRAPSSIDAKLIEADKTHGMVRVLDAAGKTIASYPAAIGSDDAP